MLGILIFSWIVSVLFVVLAERNNGYSSSLSHDEKIKRIREKRRRVEQESDEIDAKWRESKLKPKSVIRISLCRTAKRNPNDRFGINNIVVFLTICIRK